MFFSVSAFMCSKHSITTTLTRTYPNFNMFHSYLPSIYLSDSTNTPTGLLLSPTFKLLGASLQPQANAFWSVQVWPA